MARQTMVHLPFKEDLRTYQFPTFSSDKRPEIAPTEEQLSVARRLVQNMNLSQGALLVHPRCCGSLWVLGSAVETRCLTSKLEREPCACQVPADLP